MWIGIDAGGTFTDVVGFEPEAGRLHVLKTPSTPAEPARAILNGIHALLAQANCQSDAVSRVHHGTTLATNALLQGRLARTGMITTRGFRDVLDIARQRRPHLFDLRVAKPDPVVPRALRMEVSERLDERGNVVTALDDGEVGLAIDALRAAGCESIAICLLHAYANPAHEQEIAARIRERWPESLICTSNDVLSEMREYERFSTTVVNAGLLPVVSRYLNDLTDGVKAIGIARPAHIMQSNGGAASARTVASQPVSTFVSGPAAGVIGAQRLGEQLARPNLITLDMGGTSTDVCLVDQGQAAMQNERIIAGLPLRVRSLAIHTVGAGGGSIGWVDDGGLLKVGPQSAGADPGPAAYGRGGHQATVTDANLVLGRLSPDSQLAGHLEPSLALAEKALRTLGAPLGLDAAEAAAGMLRIVHTNMTGALRVVTVERGHDPRDFALVPFGGAGPLHAAELAEQLGIDRIVVPPRPGLASALGLVMADARADFSLTVAVELNATDTQNTLRDGFEELRSRARDWTVSEGHDAEVAELQFVVDMRYVGQSFELGVVVADPKTPSLTALAATFHEAHERMNGYASPDHATEIVTLRLTAIVANGDAQSVMQALARRPTASPAPAGRRPVWFESSGLVDTAILERDALGVDQTIEGPAVIHQMDATTLVPPTHRATVDGSGNLVVTRQ